MEVGTNVVRLKGEDEVGERGERDEGSWTVTETRWRMSGSLEPR